MNVTASALVMAGPWLTVRTKDWVAIPLPLEAVNMRSYVPAVAAAGVPDKVAVPLPLSVKCTPLGSAPLCDTTGAGKPLVVTTKFARRPYGEGGGGGTGDCRSLVNAEHEGLRRVGLDPVGRVDGRT